MATGQQNINIGTGDNANDGDVLRAAFRKVRKMFAEIYGDTDAENLTDTEVVPSTSFDTHITEKIEDTVATMFSDGSHSNITVTYDDSDGTLDLSVAADIESVNAGAGLTGVNEGSGDVTVNVGAGAGVTVNADDIAITTQDLYVDNTNNRVGINTSSPSYTLDVAGKVGIDGDVGLGVNPARHLHIKKSEPILRLERTSGSKLTDFIQDTDGLEIRSQNGSSYGNISFQRTNGTLTKTVMTIEGSSGDLKFFDSVSLNPASDKDKTLDFGVDGNTWSNITLDANNFYFKRDGSIKAAYDLANNRLGIGTTSPAYTLDVAGNAGFEGDLQVGTSSTWKHIKVFYNDGSHFRIDGYGLTANRTNTFFRGDVDNAKTLDIGTSAIKWQALNFNATDFTFSEGSSQRLQIATGGDISFKDTSGSSKFYWDASEARLGIGTTSPAVKFHINTGSDEIIRLETSDSNGNPYISFYQNTTRRSYIQHQDTNDNLAFASEYGGIRFFTGTNGTNEAERLFINSSGGIEIKGQGSGNTFIGESNAGNLGTSTGANNTAFGYNALAILTSGSSNIAIGPTALGNITSGNHNIAIGRQALDATETTSAHVAIGSYSLGANTTGTNNTAVGYNTLGANTEGHNNVAIGYAALDANTNGDDNVGIGYLALSGATTAINNTAVGAHAGRVITTGQMNTLIGRAAGYALTTGHYNVVVGNNALVSATDADYNIAIGHDALNDGTTCAYNIAIGAFALDAVTDQGSQVAIGYNALTSSTTGARNVAIGKSVMEDSTTASDSVAIGFNSLTNATTTLNSTALGSYSGYLLSTGNYNTVLGGSAGREITTGAGHTFVGYAAGYGATANARVTGTYNTGVGYAALYHVTSGNNNVAIGKNAGYELTSANSTTAVGEDALQNLTTGNYNTAIGRGAALNLTTGYNNVALGTVALEDETTGHSNTAIGYAALGNQTETDRNTAVGYAAGYQVTTGNDNVMLGYNAGRYRNDGTDDLNPADSVYIGHDARGGGTDASPSNEIVIGYNARGNGDNTATIGNSSITALHCQVQTITALSDARDKKEIKPITEGIDFINKLNPVTFEWDTRDGAKKDIKDSGFIAQDLLEAQKSSDIGDYLDLVDTKNEDRLQARYGNLIPVLVKALQEQQAQIDELKSKLK